MLRARLAACLFCLLCALPAQAQQAAPAAVPNGAAAGADAQAEGAAADDAADEGAAEEDDWRDTSNYVFGALADTTLRLELVAQAMQLRDFCANRRVVDEFVRDRLARFSALSGRLETCRSLMDY
jgi:hypothetical protein